MNRAEIDTSRDTFGRRVPAAAVRKILNVLVVGEREQATASVTLRVHGSKEQRLLPLTDLLERIAHAIAVRDLRPL